MARPKTKTTQTKSDAIRQALNEMGMDASPTEIAKQLQARGFDVRPNAVSQMKLLMKKQGAKPGPRAQRGAARRTGPRPTPRNGAQVNLDDVLAVRALVKRLGAENLKRLADALGD